MNRHGHLGRVRGPVLALTLALVTAAGLAGGSAAQTQPSTVALDGTVTGTGTIGGVEGCGLDLSVTFDTTVALTAGGSAGLQLAVCNSLPEPGVPGSTIYGQTFSLTTSDGTVSGTLSGRIEESVPDSNEFPLHLDLVVTAGTGALAGATGDLSFEGIAGVAGATIEGTLSGSITLVPPTTTSTSTSVAVTVTSVPAGPPPIEVAPGAQPVTASPTFTG